MSIPPVGLLSQDIDHVDQRKACSEESDLALDSYFTMIASIAPNGTPTTGPLLRAKTRLCFLELLDQLFRDPVGFV
jgi:hypothetical protein